MQRSNGFDALVLFLILVMSVAAGATTDPNLDTQARALHKRLRVIGSHEDVLLPSTPERHYAPGYSSRADLGKLEQGGVGAEVAFAVAVGHSDGRALVDSTRELER